ncbi:hypothetical protein AB6N24_06355 [Cellulomonas sp. 179-A 4D5 NHS]|uniref:hypothetical protein n=1 Tax=Cellulomonas sp. 179-A 4D5 NHS TaxID=3142378 RepID=UPI0039A2285D
MPENGDYERYFPTFKQFCGSLSDIKLAAAGRVDALWLLYHEHVRSIIDPMWDDPNCPCSPGRLVVAIPHAVIRDHLGVTWFERNIASTLAAGRGDHLLTRLMYHHRASTLARSLYELQSYDWFDGLLKKLRKDSFSGVAFEMEVLSLLQQIPAASAPQVETNAKGKDFDVLVNYKGHSVPIEAKAKADNTHWNPRTVIDTLKKASKQLPPGEAGVVFLRIPPTWVGPRLEAEYTDALHEGTRQSRRIEVVFSVIDKPHLTSESTGNVSTRYHLFRRSAPVSDTPWEMCLLLEELLGFEEFRLGPRAPF